MNNQVRRAVMLAVIGTAVSAGANAQTLLSQAIHNGSYVLASGSTAVAAAMTNYFEQALDDSNNPCGVSGTGNFSQLEVYSDSYYTAYACMSNTSVISGSSTPIAYIKESNAGSGNALLPVGSAFASNTLPFPNLTNISSLTGCATAADKTAVSKTVNGTSTVVTVPYTSYACTVASAAQSPNMGFADVDAALFGHSAGFYGVTASADLDIVFAPAVSLGLYRELQAVQGLTVGADDLADMPNLTKAELTSIFEGGPGGSSGVTNWSFFSGWNGTTAQAVGSVAGPWGSNSSDGGSYVGATSKTPSNTNIYICRRDDYSGTEKTMETYFGGLARNGGSCLAGVNSWALADEGAATELLGLGWSNAGTAVTVFPNKSTGNVLDCLEGHDSVGHYAIGYASIDNGWGTNVTGTNPANADWRFIRLDGIVPSIENAASGRWPIFAQSIATIPTSSGQTNSLQNSSANATALALQSAILGVHGIGYDKVIEAVNAQDQWVSPSIHGGILAVPNSSDNSGPNVPVDVSASDATFFAAPVNMYVKVTANSDAFSSPGNIDNCQTPTLASSNDLQNQTPVGGVTGFTVN